MTDKYIVTTTKMTDKEFMKTLGISAEQLTKSSSPQKPPYSTDVAENMKKLSATEIMEIFKSITDGHAFHNMSTLFWHLKNTGFSSVEQVIIDKFIEEYTLQYKSPLAKAMQE